MQPPKAELRDGKLVLEVDERQFLADALGRYDHEFTVVDRAQFMAFVRQHIFTLTHDIDDTGEHPTWWVRLSEALAQAAAAARRGVQEHRVAVATCGCDPEEHDGG